MHSLCYSVHGVGALVFSLVASGASTPYAATQNAPPTSPVANTADDLLRQPTLPLDARVSPEKVKELDPPSLPEQVFNPLPPDHRVASQATDIPLDAARWEAARQAIARGLEYLRSTQHASGVWARDAAAAPSDQPDALSPVSVAITALVVKAFAQNDADVMSDTALAKALNTILAAQQESGAFDSTALANYVSSAAVSALAAVDDRTLQDQLKRGVQWLEVGQWDQGEGLSARQDWFGGAGYGNNGRPDLSNTQMMLDALYDAGLSPDEPAFQRALVFLQRTQNLKATNNAEWAGHDDGGFIYTPVNGGESMASDAAGEGRKGEKIPAGEPRSLRSYGSMTYAGFKSMLYAGLSADDLRVRAAFDWLRNHWTFDENPGLGQQGLYYYYHTLARALRAGQQDTITDIAGTPHDWRAELIDALVSRQREDGSWINEADRWMEGQPDLVTAYCVLALEEAIK